MRDIIEFYNRLVSALETVLPNDFIRSSLNGYPFEPWSKETRIHLVDTLINCKHLEQQVVNIIPDILKDW